MLTVACSVAVTADSRVVPLAVYSVHMLVVLKVEHSVEWTVAMMAVHLVGTMVACLVSYWADPKVARWVVLMVVSKAETTVDSLVEALASAVWLSY